MGFSGAFQGDLARTALDNVLEYIHHRDYDRAESILKDILSHDPNDAEAWHQLGEIYLTEEDYDAARKAFQESLKQDPDYHEAQAGLWAVRLLESGNKKEVRQAVQQEIKAFVSKGEASVSRLMAAYQGRTYLHDTEAVRALAERILALKPEEEILNQISMEVAEYILIEKRVEKRLTLIDWYLSRFPKGKGRNLIFHLALKIASEDLEDLKKLQEYGERWIREDPENRIARAVVGDWYAGKGVALKKAVEYLQKALILIRHPDPADKPDHYPDRLWKEDLKKDKGHYYDTLGWAYYQMGNNEEAAKAFSKAAKLLDFDHRLNAHRGMLLERKGNLEGALQAYLKSVKAGNALLDAEEGLRRVLSIALGPSARGPSGDAQDAYGSPSQFFSRKAGITSYTDVTEEAGLSGIKARRLAWGDYDGNGFEDLLLDGRILIRNQGDGTFRGATQEAGIPMIPGARGGVWADFNNDGFLDFHTFASGRRIWDRFFKNNGDGTFKEITQTAVPEPDGYPTEAAAWGDYDRDGFVDLYVANYEWPLLRTIELAIGTPNRLLHNNGNETFSDVSQRVGTVSREKMVGRGVSWGDYNNDGFPDILVSNYRLDPNFLWKNQGDGTFRNVAPQVGVGGRQVEGYFGHTIGSVWGDYDNDGDLDLFSANLAHPRYIGYSDKSMLLENLGPPEYHFVDRFPQSGIRYEETHADPSFVDYDNDGFLDLYITSTYTMRNSFLYKGDGKGTFEDVTYMASVRVSNGWGNAFADMDNDGDLDLIVGIPDGVRLFRNNGNGHTWLQVKVVGNPSNRSGIGSRVSVVAGPFRQMREVEGGKGAGSQHSLITAFGFGDYRGTASVEVRFPSGRVVTLKRVALNQRIVVQEK